MNDPSYHSLKALFMDVDGVLTDGRLFFTAEGETLKCFHVLDGAGIKYLQEMGIFVAWITGRDSQAVRTRAKELGVELRAGVSQKLAVYQDILKIFGVKDEETGYIGDDLPDIPVLKQVAYPFTVPHACAAVKKQAHYITQCPAGQGAVREIAELILKSQNKWETLLKRFAL
jgi:3-deoxy-D-manno-octulosonate 8-phosphate phosphatase (KDO 8-P phosphatase)